MRMSIDKGYFFVWETKMLTVAMPRVQKLSDNHVVGNNKDDVEGFKISLKLKPKMPF